MNTMNSAARGDIRPLEFALAVVGGVAGSAALSALQTNPWVSVSFALTLMGVVSFIRFRMASKVRDSQSLEAFAEDIYLLGYLLTLAALLGLAPRLMEDDTNLFHIAGVKLFTTIAGLGVMMVFRQTARQWAKESGAGEVEQFERQEDLFRAAVGRLNRSAEELTLKMEEVARRFDPDLLGPVAEWSNRAANAFSGATRAFEAIPGTTASSMRSLQELSDDLVRMKLAANDLTNSLTNHLGTATQNLGHELEQVSQATQTLGTSVAKLTPAAESGRTSLEKLGAQALQEVSNLGSVNQTLVQVGSELTKVEAAMRQLGGDGTVDISAPLRSLVEALSTAADRADSSSVHMERLQGDLRMVSAASQALGERLGSSVADPLIAHENALSRIHQQFEKLLLDINQISRHLVQAQEVESSGRSKLTVEVETLRRSMEETNRQLQPLIVPSGKALAESSSGLTVSRIGITEPEPGTA